MACDSCGAKRGHLNGCPTQGSGRSSEGSAPKKSRRGTRTRVVGNLSKESADDWIKKMGKKAEGGKERHYEAVPDKDNPGKFELIFVEDE